MVTRGCGPIMAEVRVGTESPASTVQYPQKSISSDLNEQQANDVKEDRHSEIAAANEKEVVASDEMTDPTDDDRCGERRTSEEMMAAAQVMPRRKSNLKQRGSGTPGLSNKQVSFVRKRSSRDLLHITSREYHSDSTLLHVDLPVFRNAVISENSSPTSPTSWASAG